MAEHAITDSIGRLLTRRGAWWFKTHGAGASRAGIPDILAVYRGRPLALEVKQPGRQPTRLQAHTLARAAAAGAHAACVTNQTVVREMLDSIDHEMGEP